MSRRWTGGRLLLGLFILLVLPSLAFAQDRLRPGARVEVDGAYVDGTVRATKVVVEEPDEYPEIKGFADRFDAATQRIFVGPFTVLVDGRTEIEDASDGDDSYRFEELTTEWRLKIEGEFIEPFVLRAVEIDVDKDRTRTDPPVLELEGFVDTRSDEPDGTIVIVVHGVECIVAPGTEIPEGVFRKVPRLIDDDEDRPEHQLVLFGRLTIGGELQVEFEYEDDFDLDANDNQDIFEADTSATLEGLFDLGWGSYAFAKGRTSKGYVIFDEDRDKDLEETTALDELHVHWNEILDSPLSIRLGRQDFDEEREWLYDESFDAARLFFRRGSFEAEYSWGTYVADAPRGRDNLWNQIGVVRWRYGRRSYVSAYFIDILDRSRADVSPFYVGARLYGRTTSSRYWIDYAYVDGVSGSTKLSGHGLDVGAGHQFRQLPLRPYVYASYAVGSGDGKATGRTDRNFRQTGYHDNNDRIFGVASFRYYGELLRPELSNLQIATIGIGCRPTDSTSIDVVFHQYNQVHRSTTLRDSSLRASPSGGSRDIGQEIDVVLGVDDLWERWDLELDFGYFIPGGAFTTDDHPALWTAVQVEWNF